MKARVTVRISPQLRRNLNAEYTIGVPMKQYLTDATALIRDEARKEAPEDLGKMKRSHVAIVDSAPIPGWGRMEVQAVSAKGAPYPIFVHEGTKPHFPPVQAITGWAERHGWDPFALAVHISRKGTKANPWLERTMNKIQGRLLNLGGLAAKIQKQWGKP